MPDANENTWRKKALGIVVALVAYAYWRVCPHPEGLSSAGQKSLALMVSAIIVWVSDALPLAMACSLFLFLQSVLGTANLSTALQRFAIPPVFLLLCHVLHRGGLSEFRPDPAHRALDQPEVTRRTQAFAFFADDGHRSGFFHPCGCSRGRHDVSCGPVSASAE